MSTNVQPNETRKRERAALLIAQDELTDEQIAADLGYKSAKTVQRLRNDPEIAARVEEHKAAWREEIKAKGIADVQNRVDEANARHLLMKQVIAERAAAEEMTAVPGGTTGLLVRQTKYVKVYKVDEDGNGSPQREMVEVEEYAVDIGLLHEIRAHEEHVAKHLGQLVEKREDKLDATDAVLAALRNFGKSG